MQLGVLRVHQFGWDVFSARLGASPGLQSVLHLALSCSRVAQWKRAGPITQRSVDRNYALLIKVFRQETYSPSPLLHAGASVNRHFQSHCQYIVPVQCYRPGFHPITMCCVCLTLVRFDGDRAISEAAHHFGRIGERSRVAQWKRAGPITQRSVDRNYALLRLVLKKPILRTPSCITLRTHHYRPSKRVTPVYSGSFHNGL